MSDFHGFYYTETEQNELKVLEFDSNLLQRVGLIVGNCFFRKMDEELYFETLLSALSDGAPNIYFAWQGKIYWSIMLNDVSANPNAFYLAESHPSRRQLPMFPSVSLP